MWTIRWIGRVGDGIGAKCFIEVRGNSVQGAEGIKGCLGPVRGTNDRGIVGVFWDLGMEGSVSGWEVVCLIGIWSYEHSVSLDSMHLVKKHQRKMV